jgi:hypothetical protein
LKKFTLLLILTALLSAHELHEPDKKSIFKSTLTYVDVENSKQKKRAYDGFLGYDLISGRSKLQLAYNYRLTDTYQPPLKENLKINKPFAKYSYTLKKEHQVNASYMYIMDNIAPTDGGNIFGIGYTNKSLKNIILKLNQYRSDYKDFNVDQSDISLQYHYTNSGANLDFFIMGKYIHLDDYSSAIFNPANKASSPDTYFTTGLKVHASHMGYHAGVGTFLGKRMFAVMNEGFVVQHHAMEFDRTYFAKVGKKFGKFDLMLRYVYQRATETPINNPDVVLNATSLILHYHF